MSKTIPAYALVLVAASAASWRTYTSDDAPEKDGVLLLDGKREELTLLSYASPDLDVKVEQKTDAHGSYAWVSVDDHKVKKPAKEGDPPPPVEHKLSSFKAGSAADKLLDQFAPLAALRDLGTLDDAKIESFGLTAPDTTVIATVAGRTITLELGGETYGTHDRYARSRETGKIFVIDDEAFKPLKFASTRLPERSLYAAKREQVVSVSLGRGGTTAEWTQVNKDDSSARYWQRVGGEAGQKDETFGNWFDKAFKLKSQSYVQDADKPSELAPEFDLAIRVEGTPEQVLRVQKSGEDFYATGDFVRGLVKLTRSPTGDAANDVEDILAGREPPKKEAKKAAPPPVPPRPDAPKGGPPKGPPGMPGMPSMSPPGFPGMKPPAAPGAPPAAGN